MFGKFFGNSEPTVKIPPAGAVDEGLEDIDIRHVIGGLMDPNQVLTEDDYTTIRTRARKIQKQHLFGVDPDTAIKLAFLDRTLIVARAAGINSYTEGFRNTDLVSPFVSDDKLATDEVFLNKVIDTAEDMYTAGKESIYSEALFKAITLCTYEARGGVADKETV